jgi:hypothetical protein
MTDLELRHILKCLYNAEVDAVRSALKARSAAEPMSPAGFEDVFADLDPEETITRKSAAAQAYVYRAEAVPEHEQASIEGSGDSPAASIAMLEESRGSADARQSPISRSALEIIDEAIAVNRTAISAPVQVDKEFKELLETASDNEKQLIDLALSQKPQEAADFLLKNDDIDEKYFSIVAYKIWSANDLTTALNVAESGLAIAKNRITVGRLKNSLAFYYAEHNARSGTRTYEEQAKTYAQDAKGLLPPEYRWELMDTEGFVKLVYADNSKEVREAMTLVLQAVMSLGRLGLLPEMSLMAKKQLQLMEPSVPICSDKWDWFPTLGNQSGSVAF